MSCSTFETEIRRGIPWSKTFVVNIDDVLVDFTGYTHVVRIGSMTLDGVGEVELGSDGTIVLSLDDERTLSMREGRKEMTIDLVSSGGVAFEPRIRGYAEVES